MKIHLAGYNVDTAVLKELQKKGGARKDLTPEVLSAAYARISRDARSIEELRADARGEVERTRKSNATIIFKMGHHSVAEHAVFNLDIIGVSRYAMEELEKFRLCSYTEKSQRYITLDNDFIVPQELRGNKLENVFIETVQMQNTLYAQLYKKLKTYFFEKHSSIAADPKKHALLEGWAKEDARYCTALASASQAGMTVNARNLELILRRFASHPLAEVNALGRALYEQIAPIAPSIVIFHQANDRDTHTYPDLTAHTQALQTQKIPAGKSCVRLAEYTPNGDAVIAAALLHASSNRPYEECTLIAKCMSASKRMQLFKTAFRHMQLYDSTLREFEFANLTYSIVLSAACFGQLKRHRMSTISAQKYDPSLGITTPASITAIGMAKRFAQNARASEKAYAAIAKKIPLAAPYILTNAHRKRVLMRVNAREMYHIARLREDTHAQWDIQNISRAMSAAAKKVMPCTFALCGGKDRYAQLYTALFGNPPKIVHAALPGVRTIKA